MRATIAGLAAAATAATILAAAPTAHADGRHIDHRACVSTREWRGAFKRDDTGAYLTHGWTRRQLERRWEVKGLGFPVQQTDLSAVGIGPTVTIGYPRCGYSTDVAWYGASYQKHGHHYLMATHSHREG